MSITHFGALKPGDTGNLVIRTISEDPLLGYDQYDQFWVYEKEDDGMTRWMVRDLSAEPKVKCPICQQGWDPTNVSLKNQTYLDSMKRFAHASCMNGYRHVRDFSFWHGLFCSEGVNYFGMEIKEIPNGYWPKRPRYPSEPWYRIRLRHAPKLVWTVGARKRVNEISIDGLDESWARLVESQFTEIKHTKDVRRPNEVDPSWGFSIHAWTEDETKTFVKVIAKLIPPPTAAEKEAATTEHYAAERERREPAPW